MFLIHTIDDGRVPPLEYLPAGAITPKLGLALGGSGGVLAVCSGANKPLYLSMTERGAAVTSGTSIPVMRVAPDVVFETVWSESAAERKLGDRVTLASDGLRVTATTTNGVAEIVGMDGTGAGDKVRVRFS